jgi:O-antigen ligase
MIGARPWLHWSSVVVLAVTIVLFACGSSSVPAVLSFGQHARWAGLFALCGLTFVQGGLRRPARPAPLFLTLVTLTTVIGALALLSGAWSISSRLTEERSVTLLVLFAAGASLAYAVSAEPRIWPWILRAVLAAAVVVCLLGLLVLAVAHDDAVQAAFPGTSARYQGLGQNPNTVAMLAAVAMPVAFWLVAEATARSARIAGWLALALLFGTIAAANSRGALIASVVAILVYGAAALRSAKARAATVVLVACMFAGSYGVYQVMPSVPAGAGSLAGSGTPGGARGPAGAYFPGALYDEVGRPLYGPTGEISREALGTSGRLLAWEGALHQGDQRPLLGFGFGTEERVFVDRYYTFQGSRPENSYLGLYLQLGALGVALLLGAWLVLARGYVSILRSPASPHRSVAAVCAGVVGAGLVLTLIQSYVYSVGNIASVSFWVCAFLLTVVATWHQSPSGAIRQ